MIPSVVLTQRDGATGIQPSSPGGLLAVVGNSSAGTVDTPASFGTVNALVSAFGYGPGVEAAALHINLTGKPVLFVKATNSVAGAAGTVTTVGTGTSVTTCNTTSTKPYDDFEVVFTVTLGGTIGTGPITFTYSLDGGRTTSPAISLGTANTYTIPNSGVVLNFAAGTLVTGDVVTFRTTAPCFDATSLGTALAALGNSATKWGLVHVVGTLAATTFDAIETKFSGWAGQGKFRAWIGHWRVPNLAESDATYLAAFNTALGAKATTYGSVCLGAADTNSAVSGRSYMRPPSFICASREAAASEEVNQGDVNLGSLPVSIRDTSGNPRHRDEFLQPGGDDLRAYVLRTHPNIQGVYVNRPLLFSAAGSDFVYMPHRRVYNIAAEVLHAYFTRRLMKQILVADDTGFMKEEERLEMEAGALAVLEAALRAKPKASGVSVSISATDNLLTTSTITVEARIIPLAYPTTINVALGFTNPALNLVRV